MTSAAAPAVYHRIELLCCNCQKEKARKGKEKGSQGLVRGKRKRKKERKAHSLVALAARVQID